MHAALEALAAIQRQRQAQAQALEQQEAQQALRQAFPVAKGGKSARKEQMRAMQVRGQDRRSNEGAASMQLE